MGLSDKEQIWYGLSKTSHKIGIGCWQISGQYALNGKMTGWGHLDESEAVEILSEALLAGFDCFDTAAGYGHGSSEIRLGKAIQATQKSPIVITKTSMKPEELQCKKLGENFVGRVLESRDRLQVNQIDVLLLHNPPDDLSWHEFDTDALLQLKQDGLIATFGVSCQGLKGALNVAQHKFGTVIEWVYNIFERRPQQALFSLCKKNHINFIARSPLSRGLINDKYLTVMPSFAEEDFRKGLSPDWVEYILTQLKKFHQNGVKSEDLVEKALAFCCAADEVTAVIPGIKSKNQLQLLIDIRNRISEFHNNLLFDIPSHYPKWS